jgi:hypothetical protein
MNDLLLLLPVVFSASQSRIIFQKVKKMLDHHVQAPKGVFLNGLCCCCCCFILYIFEPRDNRNHNNGDGDDFFLYMYII